MKHKGMIIKKEIKSIRIIQAVLTIENQEIVLDM
jgi:hypothetical protein